MIKTIIFDLGGVYLNRGIWIFREEYLKTKFNIPKEKSQEALMKFYKPYFSGAITEQEFWKGFIQHIGIKANWKELRKELLNSFAPQKEVVELIKKLRKDYKIGLLSDQTREWWPELNKKYKIDKDFDFVVISYETKFHKPQPEIYNLAIKKSGFKPEECLYIDDLEKNLPPAEDLGIKTLLFENLQKLERDLKRLKIF